MLTQVQIPGFGAAVAGLDWLGLPGMDGLSTEIKQLGRGVDAAWQYVWSVKGQEDQSVAFVAKGEAKKRPVAAAALVRAAIAEDLYLALVDAGDERLWVFAVKDGMPFKRMDLVGEASEVMGLVSDFLTTLPDTSKAPIYTDKPVLLKSLPYSLDVRTFSLEILGHSIRKRDFSKASFSRYTSAPIGALVCCTVLIVVGCAYYIYQLQAEEADRRDAMLKSQRAVAQRKLELAAAVSTAINATVPARVAVPAYLEAARAFKRLVEGWKLTGVECSGQGCTLTFKAQPFATWAGYLKAKPQDWPPPMFDSDIEKITQPVPVTFPTVAPRTAEALPPRERVRFDLGNLAQISKTLGLSVTLPSAWARVAGKAGPDEQWVPMVGIYGAQGSSVLLKDLALRLPDISDVTSVSFKLDDNLSFDLKGNAYANP